MSPIDVQTSFSFGPGRRETDTNSLYPAWALLLQQYPTGAEGFPCGWLKYSYSEGSPRGGLKDSYSEGSPRGGLKESYSEGSPRGGLKNGYSEGSPRGGVKES